MYLIHWKYPITCKSLDVIKKRFSKNLFTFIFRFIKNFRLNKEAFKYLLSKIDASLKLTTRSGSVLPIIKLAATLRFYAEGGYQTGAGNEFLCGLAQPTFSKILTHVTELLENEICPQYICFPSSDAEKKSIKLGFFEKYNFPGVIGCVDGTHIKIISPSKRDRHLYMNRKGFYSLNVMVVSNMVHITFISTYLQIINTTYVS